MEVRTLLSTEKKILMLKTFCVFETTLKVLQKYKHSI